jgi:hypothetical protein
MPSNAANNIDNTTKSRAYRSTFFVFMGVWCLGLLACLALALGLWANGYDVVTLKVANALVKADQLLVLRTHYFTPALFLSLRVSSWLLLLAWSWLYFRRTQFTLLILHLGRLIKLAFTPLLASWHNCSLSQKTALAITFMGLLASRLYYSTMFTLQYDEAFTYIHLVSKGVFTSAIYYPGPNNHVFFSELAAILHTGLPTLVALRLPSIVASLAVWFLLWQWLHTHTRFGWAWLLATWGMFIPSWAVYSVAGRGYSLQLLFILLTFRSVLATHYQAQHRLVLIVSSVLGFYTIPTFLYPFATLVVLQIVRLWQNKQLLKRCLIDVCFILVFVGVLYSPIVLANGVGALVSNAWVQSLSFTTWWQQLPAYLLTWSSALFGEPWGQWFGLAYLLIGGWLFIFRRKASLWLWASVLVPLVMISLQSVLPPHRVWLWWWLPWVYAVAVALGKKMTKAKASIVYVCLGVACLFLVIHTSLFFAQIPTKSFPYIQVAQKIESMPTPQRVFVQHDTYGVYLQYMRLHASKKPLIDTKLDPQVKYDWLILKKPLSKRGGKGYKVFLENEEVVVCQYFE